MSWLGGTTEETKIDESQLTPQPIPIIQSKQTTQSKPATPPKQVTQEEYWSIIKNYVTKYEYIVLSEKYICQIHQETLYDISKIETDLKRVIELLKNKSNKPVAQPKPATPKVLNESDLFNCVKAIPIRFDFNYQQMKENQKLNELCNMLLSGDMISQVLDAGNIENFERNLQTKRLRNTKQEDYNKSLENNILFELYKYSSLMNLFKVLEDRKSDKVKINN